MCIAPLPSALVLTSLPVPTGDSLWAFSQHISIAAVRVVFAGAIPIETTETTQAQAAILRQAFMTDLSPISPDLSRYL